MSDMEAMFQRLSMEQEERHRQQTAALEERHRQQTEELQKHLESLEARPRLSPSESSRGVMANRGRVTQAKRRSLRYIQRGLPPPEAIVPELDEVGTALTALEEDDEILGDNEGEPEERLTGGKKGVSDKTNLQVRGNI
jgi:chromosome condensin MukBEF ATPase and DNA-binding subunit MukB